MIRYDGKERWIYMDLELQNVIKYYGDKCVLKDISITLQDVGVLALIGPSGSGKSTLLRLMAGLESFDGGKIIVGGVALEEKNLKEYRKQIGFVFQDHNLFSHLSILENICLVLEKVHQVPRKEAEKRANLLLEKFGLEEHKHKLSHQISGGQSQRVSIVRALSIEPKLMMLDEPTSSLDPILTYDVLLSIRTLLEQKKDVMLVTHEIGFAKEIADYILYMEDGRIVEHGNKEIFDSPKTKELKEFLDKVLSFA